MNTKMRKVMPGQVFQLCRTLERFTMLRRHIEAPTRGTRYIVQRIGANEEMTLHHSCNVWIEGAA